VYVVKFDTVKREPFVEVYDWHDYWLEKVDINTKSFKPKIKEIIYFSQIRDYKAA